MGRSDNGDDLAGVLTSRAAMFGVAGLMALTLVGAGSWFWGQRTGASEAVRDARARTETLAARIIQANVIGGLIAGDATAVQAVDRLASDQDAKVVGVTLSSVDGHAVYSKNPTVLGTTTPLSEAALQSLQAGQPSAELGIPSSPSGGPVLRVNHPAQPPGGEALLLQTDYDYRAVTADGRRVWQMFAPVTLGTLFLLGVVWMCLGWVALRRPRKPHGPFGPFEAAPGNWLEAAPDMATRAFQAPEPAPAGVAARVEPQPDEGGWLGELRGGAAWPAGPFTNPVPEDDVLLPGALRAGAPGPRHGVEALRPLPAPQPEPHANANSAARGNGLPNGNGAARGNGLPNGKWPPNGNGKPRSLETALSGMLLPLARRGIDTRLDLPAGLRLPSDTEELLLWAAEEAVRNTVAHGQAQTVKVRVDVHDHRVELTVDDDGRGFDPDELTSPSPNGQVSLRTLTQLAANAGGALRVRSAPNRGTRLHLDLPAC
ncbi:MAG: ATP-binding protein [Egibacteraceae bacterium]